MPTQILIELSEDLNERLTQLASSNHRSKRKEAVVAVEWYLNNHRQPFYTWSTDRNSGPMPFTPTTEAEEL